MLGEPHYSDMTCRYSASQGKWFICIVPTGKRWFVIITLYVYAIIWLLLENSRKNTYVGNNLFSIGRSSIIGKYLRQLSERNKKWTAKNRTDLWKPHFLAIRGKSRGLQVNERLSRIQLLFLGRPACEIFTMPAWLQNSVTETKW